MNRERLRLAVDNLIANAVQAIEQKGAIKGRIAVGASESRLDDDKYLDISVTDDGLGFGALDVEQIGREFPQGLAHGIGLYQVRRVAESSGGSFSSVPRPDGGTRATMSLNLSCIPHFRKRWLVKRSE
jgi:signal transduction histidine kinase